MRTRTIKFCNNREIPQIGIGTYSLTGRFAVNTLKKALQQGYRHLDCASMYENSIYVKQAIEESKIERKELFITSKINRDEQGYIKAIEATKKILQELNMNYLDLMLIHWPGVSGIADDSYENAVIRLQTYRGLVEMQQKGLIKDIGVSNFLPRHLEHLLENSTMKPVLNQIEIHPLGWDRETVKYCKQKDIVLASFSPLAKQDSRLIDDEYLKKLGEKYQKSSGQIALRWNVQKGNVVLPMSTSDKNIAGNLEIFEFELEDKEMSRIDEMNKEIRVVDLNPETITY